MIELSQLNGGAEERGQVGIGTLIVFIAMVLVAAIAAGVLVNTAGFLQATAEDAGQESVDKVTNRIEVVNQHGVVGTDDTVKKLNLTVRLAAGSSAVDLNSSSVKYLSDTEVTTLTNNSAPNAGTYEEHEFNITQVDGTDSDDSFGVLNDGADRFVIKIDTGKIEDGTNTEGLSTGDKVQLDITSQTGGTTTVILSMPQQLAGASEDDPIRL